MSTNAEDLRIQAALLELLAFWEPDAGQEGLEEDDLEVNVNGFSFMANEPEEEEEPQVSTSGGRCRTPLALCNAAHVREPFNRRGSELVRALAAHGHVASDARQDLRAHAPGRARSGSLGFGHVHHDGRGSSGRRLTLTDVWARIGHSGEAAES